MMHEHDAQTDPGTPGVRSYPHVEHDPAVQLDTGYGGWGSPENKTITERITADRVWLAEHGVHLSVYGPDPVSGKVKVYLTHYTDAARRILVDRYGTAIVVSTQSTPLATA